ncbi:chorismate synthase [Lawsonibacter sp. NSJ-51]|uniref:Chorismate synthase n=1 Tax=Lawsonibacter hominis TaxID=2763053 RepID=A0A8J6J6F2_9FIRM|nr:chorismate synthase [Lawsonibacter sp.]MBC5733631.1 chorismate synthase [Lawsonibacter hominis]MBS1382946.1 chorismate synthase [Flavonifractor sp.]
MRCWGSGRDGLHAQASRRVSGVQAFWQGQNLAAGGIHSRRGCKRIGDPRNACVSWARHDPCIVPRAVPVIEAAAALAACAVLGL